MSAKESESEFVRPSLDGDDGEEEEEEEEELNSQGRSRMVDDDEEEEEEIEEPTDEELIQELAIENERKAQEIEKLRQEMIANGTLNENDTFPNDTLNIPGFGTNIKQPEIEANPNAQLTTFQENIITTGSGVSVILLVILAIAFIIQFIRKVYQHFKYQRLENSVESVIVEAVPQRAEDIGIGTDANSYAVYNTEFEEREEYEAAKSNGADLSILKSILEKRAIRCVQRASVIQRDAPGIRKNWQLDLLPKEVWEDFNAGQGNVNNEIQLIIKENDDSKFEWGPNGNNILLHARNCIQFQNTQRHMQFRQRMQQQRRMQQRPKSDQNRPIMNGPNPKYPMPSQNNAPNSKNFGDGFNRGFLNQSQSQNQNPNKPQEKLTRRQKKKLKAQQAQQGGASAVSSGQSAQYNVGADDFAPSAQTKPTQRRKKGRRRRN